MSIEQYRMLLAVADTGGLKSASDKLFKTQPAISQGIKQLESRLGIELFNREGYRLQLTAAGIGIYNQAQRLLAEEEKLQQLAMHLRGGHEARVVLAVNASYPMHLVLPVLKAAQAAFKQTQILLTQEYVTGAVDRLTEGQADLALTPVSPALGQDSRFQYAELPQQYLVNVAVPEMQPVDRQLVSMMDQYQIVVKDTGTGSGSVDFGVQDGQRRWYVNDFQTKKDFIANGMGWGRLPEYLVAEELRQGKLVKLQLEQMQSSVPVAFKLMRYTKQFHGPVCEYLWKAFSDED